VTLLLQLIPARRVGAHPRRVHAAASPHVSIFRVALTMQEA
jgi:hypothetical protein